MDVEAAAPEPGDPRFRRRLSVLVGVAALAAASLSLLESDAGRAEEQAFTDASRAGIEVFVKLAASQPRVQFELGTVRESAVLDALSANRASSVTTEIEPFLIAVAQSIADNRAARRVLLLGKRLRQVPAEAPGLDAAASEAIRVQEQADIEPVVAAQQEAVERAGEDGTRQERAMFALGVVAIAASLLGLAGLMGAGRGGNLSLATAAGLLVLAIAWGGSGLLV